MVVSKMLRYSVKSHIRGEGLTPYSPQELDYLKSLKVEVKGEDIFINLKPRPEDYGHQENLRPAIDIIKEYVKFYMARYSPRHPQEQVEYGLWCEKAFDLLLQSLGVPKDYAEPIRDWRGFKPCEFNIPFIGKVDVKSAKWCNRILGFRVRVYNWKRENPDYVVVLYPVDWKRERVWIKLMGAMERNKVESYPEIKTDQPFWEIPCADLTIKPVALYNALMQVKDKLDKARRINLLQV